MLRGRDACMGIFGIFWEFLGGLLVRHVIPRGFAVPLCGLARAKMCRWGVLCLLDGLRRYAVCVGVTLAWEFLGFFGNFWEGYWCVI